MISKTEKILQQGDFTRESLAYLLKTQGNERQKLLEYAHEVKKHEVGLKTYFRGLLEFSNICAKNCYYCGIRRGNGNVERYFMTEDEIISQVQYAIDNHYASIVLQSGERTDRKFTQHITDLLRKITAINSGQSLGITLSMGEQSEEVYKEWQAAGANRYLIRIEASNPELYKKLHPDNSVHNYQRRLDAIERLKALGYQTGTGVMIGLPFQDEYDLADDLLFMQRHDIDMVGMGPYIEHQDTPLYRYRDQLMPKEERFDLSLKMVALLRIMMKDINIAATTAMQTLDPLGREKAIKVGANVIMPNLTPVKYREGYLLYEDKPCLDEEAEDCHTCLEARISIAGDEIGYDEPGTSLHYQKRMKKTSNHGKAQ
ncbi:MAG: [FeFe] hydrogenase H-cluster radical SAM maturase HydE [Bacteroidota bacterium]